MIYLIIYLEEEDKLKNKDKKKGKPALIPVKVTLEDVY